MKCYPVTEDELQNLGLLQAASTASFSIGSFLAAFFLGVRSSTDLSNGVSPDVLAYWKAMSTASGIAALVFFLIGVVAFCRGRSKIQQIKDGTDHG